MIKVGPDAASPVQIKPMFVTELGLLCPERCWRCDQTFFQLEIFFSGSHFPKNSKEQQKRKGLEEQQLLFLGSFIAQLFLRRPNSKGALDAFK